MATSSIGWVDCGVLACLWLQSRWTCTWSSFWEMYNMVTLTIICVWSMRDIADFTLLTGIWCGERISPEDQICQDLGDKVFFSTRQCPTTQKENKTKQTRQWPTCITGHGKECNLFWSYGIGFMEKRNLTVCLHWHWKPYFGKFNYLGHAFECY